MVFFHFFVRLVQGLVILCPLILLMHLLVQGGANDLFLIVVLAVQVPVHHILVLLLPKILVPLQLFLTNLVKLLVIQALLLVGFFLHPFLR